MLLLLVLILFSIVSTYFGCFILWNRITNYFDSFGHSAIFAASIASLFHISEISSLMIFSFLFSVILFICISFKIKLNNTLLIILSSAFIASGVLIQDYHENLHKNEAKQIIQKENMSHNLAFNGSMESQKSENDADSIEKYVGCIHENDSNNFFDFLIGIPLQKWPGKKIFTITVLLISIFIVSLFFARNWFINIINQNIYVKKRFDKFAEFVFLVLIGFFSIIMVKFSGVLFAVSLSIFPAIIANYFKKGPLKTIFIACILNVVFTILSYYIMISNKEINFNIILLALQFLTFIIVASYKKIYQIYIAKPIN